MTIPVRREEARDLVESAPGSQSDTVVDTEKMPERLHFYNEHDPTIEVTT